MSEVTNFSIHIRVNNIIVWDDDPAGWPHDVVYVYSRASKETCCVQGASCPLIFSVGLRKICFYLEPALAQLPSASFVYVLSHTTSLPTCSPLFIFSFFHFFISDQDSRAPSEALQHSTTYTAMSDAFEVVNAAAVAFTSTAAGVQTEDAGNTNATSPPIDPSLAGINYKDEFTNITSGVGSPPTTDRETKYSESAAAGRVSEKGGITNSRYWYIPWRGQSIRSQAYLPRDVAGLFAYFFFCFSRFHCFPTQCRRRGWRGCTRTSW